MGCQHQVALRPHPFFNKHDLQSSTRCLPILRILPAMLSLPPAIAIKSNPQQRGLLFFPVSWGYSLNIGMFQKMSSKLGLFSGSLGPIRFVLTSPGARFGASSTPMRRRGSLAKARHLGWPRRGCGAGAFAVQGSRTHPKTTGGK